MASRAIRILGLDPGLQHTGWGLIETDGYRLRFIAEGVVSTRREAQTIFYRLADPAAARIIETLAELFCPPDMRTKP